METNSKIENAPAEQRLSYEAAYNPDAREIMIISLIDGEPATDIIFNIGDGSVEVKKDESGDALLEFTNEEGETFRYPLIGISDGQNELYVQNGIKARNSKYASA